MRLLGCLLAAGLVVALPGPAGAAGAWTTLARAYSYTDLLAVGDTVWCATLEAGLLRFDPVRGEFERLTREPDGLQSNHLSALALDVTGRLWVGTQGAGVGLLAQDRRSWELLARFDGIPSDTVTALRAYGDTVYVGTTKGIALWDGHKVAGAIPDGVNASPFASNWIDGVVQIGDSVFVSTLAGVYVTHITEVPLTWTAINQGLFVAEPLGLATDGSRLFTFVGTVPYRFDFEAGQWRFAGNWPAVGKVARLSDDNGVVAIATPSGIYRWDPAAPPPFPGDPPGDWVLIRGGPPYQSSDDPANLARIYAVATDPSGASTYAANQDGVRVLTSGCTQCPPYLPAGPPGNNINNLTLQGSTLYLTTLVEGVGRFDGSAWRHWFVVSCPQGGCDTTFLNPAYPFALMADRQGKKWVACWSGALEEFDDSVSPPQFVHHLEAWSEPIPNPERHSFGWATAQDPDGGRWFGLETNGAGNPPPPPIGLDYYSAAGDYVRNFRPDSVHEMNGSQIRGLAVDHRGRFWVGYTGQGLQYFDWPLDQTTGKPKFFDVGGSSTLYIQSLALYGDSLWVLTTQDLRRYNARNAQLVSGSIVDPPGATVQNAVRPLALGPDGSVWLGTENGLRIYRPGGGIEDFDTDNSPIASNEVRAIAVDPVTGVAWIGTSAGLSRYDPFYVPNPGQPSEPLKLKLWPNPGPLTGIGTLIRIEGNGVEYQGGVYDLSGRRMRRFSGVLDGQVIWDGRDEKGAVVKPGVYFVRVISGARTATARVALVR